MPDKKQIAYKKHLKQFEEHVRHFEQLDNVLEKFAHEHGFSLEKNQLHRPCRVLRKKGNPAYVIEIFQEGDWHAIAYRQDLPHTLIVVAHFVDGKQEFVYERSENVACFVHFSTIQKNLSDYLDKALTHIEKWPADVIFREGAKSEHPMVYWRKRGGIKVEVVE